jgi:hypothetical protein
MPTKEVHLDVQCVDRAMASVVRNWLAEQSRGPSAGVTAAEPPLDDLQAADPLVVGLVIGFAALVAEGAAKELGKQLVGGVEALLKSLYQRLFGRPAADEEVAADQEVAAIKSVTVRLSQRQEMSITLSQRTTTVEIERYAEVVVHES